MKSILKNASTSLVIIAFAVPANATGFELHTSGFVRHGGQGVAGFQSAAPNQRNASDEPGYPSLGKAQDACGIGNVFVVYEEGGTHGNTNHRFDCAD
jgi:hypothetical protein